MARAIREKGFTAVFSPASPKKINLRHLPKKNPENANMYTRLICAFYYYVSLSLSYFSKIAYSKTSVNIIWDQKLKLTLTEASIMVHTVSTKTPQQLKIYP